MTQSSRNGTKAKWITLSRFMALIFVCCCVSIGARTMRKASSLSNNMMMIRYYAAAAATEPRHHFESSSASILNNSRAGDYYTLTSLSGPPISRVHCLSETFSNNNNNSAVFRSCRYENLCYDLEEKQFVEYPSEEHWNVRSLVLQHENNIYLSSVPKPVMLSSVALDPEGASLWVPQARRQDTHDSATNASAQYHDYYMLQQRSREVDDDDIVWIPIQPCFGGTPGKRMTEAQILFDLYLPIYTLMEIFELQNKRMSLLLIGDKIHGSNHCLESIYDLADMMGIAKSDIVSIHDLHTLVQTTHTLNLDAGSVVPYNTSSIVCNKISVTGIGAHASSEVPRPKNTEQRGVPPTSIRRASNLRGFRAHLLRHMGISPHLERVTPYRIVVSSLVVSSETGQSLQRAFPHVRISQLPSNCTVRQQIEILKDAAAFICLLGEEKSGALFLPEGAVLIMLRRQEAPANQIIDQATHWDFWNNNALIRTHLILDGENISQAMEYIIRDEVDRLAVTKVVSSATSSSTRDEQEVMFAGKLVTLVHASPPPTRVHCLGEKIFPNNFGAQQFRSCHFENLCFNLETRSFVINPSHDSEELLRSLPSETNYFSSVPKLLPDPPVEKHRINASSYYIFDGVWLAMRTLNTCNPGHLLWDSWLPLYSILEMFGLEEEPLLISRYRGKSDCPPINGVYEAAFGFPNRTFRHDSETIMTSTPQSQYVCASHAAMGFGWLNDHGASQHGWQPSDLEYPVNLRRGPELERFRARILRGMRINATAEPPSQQQAPPRVAFISKSSRHEKRIVDFEHESNALQNFMPDLNITMLDMGRLLSDHYFDSINRLIMLATNTSIYVSAVGGANAAAFFLPKGASLILYGDRNMYLDFDLFNNYAHLRVHWLSLSSRNISTQLLLELIRDELHSRGRAR